MHFTYRASMQSCWLFEDGAVLTTASEYESIEATGDSMLVQLTSDGSNTGELSASFTCERTTIDACSAVKHLQNGGEIKRNLVQPNATCQWMLTCTEALSPRLTLSSLNVTGLGFLDVFDGSDTSDLRLAHEQASSSSLPDVYWTATGDSMLVQLNLAVSNAVDPALLGCFTCAPPAPAPAF